MRAWRVLSTSTAWKLLFVQPALSFSTRMFLISRKKVSRQEVTSVRLLFLCTLDFGTQMGRSARQTGSVSGIFLLGREATLHTCAFMSG